MCTWYILYGVKASKIRISLTRTRQTNFHLAVRSREDLYRASLRREYRYTPQRNGQYAHYGDP